MARHEKERFENQRSGRSFKLRAAKRQQCPPGKICHGSSCNKSRSRQALNRGSNEEAGGWKKTGRAVLVRKWKQRFEKKRHRV
jgi:hypothetical protein